MINTELIIASLPLLLHGAVVTLQITALTALFGFVGGTIIGVLQTSEIALAEKIISVYVALLRGTPMLIQITFFYFVLPQIGVTMSSFWAAALAIGINSSAYVSQIVVSGIRAVSRGQIEAAQVLGFSRLQIARFIVVPQALSIVLPALAGECVTLLKDSSLASIIGVQELYKEARAIMNQSYDVVTVFSLVAVLYLIMTCCVSWIFKYLEKRSLRIPHA